MIWITISAVKLSSLIDEAQSIIIITLFSLTLGLSVMEVLKLISLKVLIQLLIWIATFVIIVNNLISALKGMQSYNVYIYIYIGKLM